MRALVSAFAVVLAASVHAGEKPWYPGCPATIKNSHECAQYLERKALGKFSRFASREGNVLILKLEGGGIKHLSDKDQTPGDTLYYNLTDLYRDIGYALVQGQYWEGDTYFLVNMRTGQIEDIGGRPVVSPGKVYLASANFGGISGFTKPLVRIYRLTKPHLTLEWSSTGWEPSDPTWVSDSELVLFRNVFSEELYRKYQHSDDWYIKEKLSIVFKDGKWTIGPGKK